jgi:SAM-dependent methyltransferase
MDSDAQKRIWDHWQGAKPESFGHSTARLRWLAARVSGRVLNVGIGNGEFERAALEHGAQVHSLDPSPSAVETIRERLDLGDRARCGSAAKIPWPDRSFDRVVVSEVLEHLDPDTLERALAEFERVLDRGGRLLGTVPARENLDEQRVLCPYCDREFHRWGHERSFDPAGLAALLERRFRVVSVGERVFVTWAALNWKGRLAAAARIGMKALGAGVSNANLVFVAERKGPA